jgi:hypothetical protein
VWKLIPLLLFGALLVVGAIASRGEHALTFERVATIAKPLVDAGCAFSIKDESRDGVEDKTLQCTVDGKGPFAIVHYTSYDDPENPVIKYGLGFTTGDRYFQYQTTIVRPTGEIVAGQPVLDAAAFTEAVREDCGCGEVLTPDG